MKNQLSKILITLIYLVERCRFDKRDSFWNNGRWSFEKKLSGRNLKNLFRRKTNKQTSILCFIIKIISLLLASNDNLKQAIDIAKGLIGLNSTKKNRLIFKETVSFYFQILFLTFLSKFYLIF